MWTLPLPYGEAVLTGQTPFSGQLDPKAGQVVHQAPFSSTVHGAFSFGKPKENGGCICLRPLRRKVGANGTRSNNRFFFAASVIE